MIRILISGYYGFNNIGDESILSAVVENLREKLEDIEITVLSKNQILRRKYGLLFKSKVYQGYSQWYP